MKQDSISNCIFIIDNNNVNQIHSHDVKSCLTFAQILVYLSKEQNGQAAIELCRKIN